MQIRETPRSNLLRGATPLSPVLRRRPLEIESRQEVAGARPEPLTLFEGEFRLRSGVSSGIARLRGQRVTEVIGADHDSGRRRVRKICAELTVHAAFIPLATLEHRELDSRLRNGDPVHAPLHRTHVYSSNHLVVLPSCYVTPPDDHDPDPDTDTDTDPDHDHDHDRDHDRDPNRDTDRDLSRPALSTAAVT